MERDSRVIENSAWVTESWSSRARCARSSDEASSAAWRRRPRSSFSRSDTSRAAPCAPRNRPSATIPMPVISIARSRPSRVRTLRRERCASVGRRWSQRKRAIAPRRPSSGARSANERPTSSWVSQPRICSAWSDTNVNRPSASVIQTRSGDDWTR